MIIDNYLVMSDAQEVISASAASTSHIDTLAAGDAIAPGAKIHVVVNTAYAVSSGSPTLTLALQCDDNTNFTSAKTLHATSALAFGSMTAGAVLISMVIPETCERFIRMYYTLGGTGSFSAGKLDARIVLDTAKTVDKQL